MSSKKYYEDNKAAIRARQASYYEVNKEKIRAQRKANAKAYKLTEEQAQKYSEAKYFTEVERLYGLVRDTYLELLSEQGGACRICKKTSSKRLCVDHCHKTGVVRGLLCRRCNLAIGLFDDDIALLEAAQEYLCQQ